MLSLAAISVAFLATMLMTYLCLAFAGTPSSADAASFQVLFLIVSG